MKWSRLGYVVGAAIGVVVLFVALMRRQGDGS